MRMGPSARSQIPVAGGGRWIGSGRATPARQARDSASAKRARQSPNPGWWRIAAAIGHLVPGKWMGQTANHRPHVRKWASPCRRAVSGAGEVQ